MKKFVVQLKDRATVKFLMAKNFLTAREEGATLVEYALLVALIAIACIVAIGTLSGGIQTLFDAIGTKLSGTKVN